MRGRALLTVAAVTVLALVLVLVLVVRSSGRSSSLDHARQLVEADANFVTATEAGVTFTKISTDLQDEGEACGPGDAPARCDALFTGAAYARVSAAAVLRCTRPGVFDARAAMRRYLEALAASDDADPDMPAVIRCR